jgi:hypothetical protein
MQSHVAIHLSGLAVALTLPVIAAAEEFESHTTMIAASACRTVSRVRVAGSEIASTRACPGRGGYFVLISEDDLRESLSVGRTVAAAKREPAFRQSFSAFNGYEDRIEWRSVKRARAPFALIADWYLSDQANEDKEGRPTAQHTLVVFRLPPGPVCKVAYVDLKANANAQALARKAAEDVARTFNCASGRPHTIGARGRTTEMLFPRS